MNLLGTLSLRIVSDELQINNLDSRVNGTWNVLQIIPIESGNFGLILFDNISKNEMPLFNKNLNGFDIKILDDDGNLVNFNGINWNMTFIINVKRLRKDKSKTNFNEIIKPINKLINVLENQNMPQDNQETIDTQENPDNTQRTWAKKINAALKRK